jgi:hypothetical protein
MSKQTRLVEWRKATPKERKDKGAEVVFVREDSDGREYTIYGCTCYESWEQWGAYTEILSDNVSAIEAWRSGELEEL